METKTIKKVPMVPFALMLALIEAILAFIVAIIYVATMGVFISAIPGAAEQVGIIAGLGLAALIVFPVVTFIVVFIIYAILAILYNVLAPRIGGIKLEFE